MDIIEFILRFIQFLFIMVGVYRCLELAGEWGEKRRKYKQQQLYFKVFGKTGDPK